MTLLAPHPHRASSALDRLKRIVTPQPPQTWVYPGYRRGLISLCLGMALSISLLGLTMPYYNKAASDMVSVYEALVFNSGLAQDFIVYPSVIGRALLGWWLRVLSMLGVVPVWQLEQLPDGANLKAYEAVWQKLIEAGRVFSLGIGMITVVSFVSLVRRWLGSWQIAVLAGIALAFSSGVALGFRILRPEMMAAGLVYASLLLVFLAARDVTPRRFATLGLAGFLVALALIEKVQSLIPALAILPLALAFGQTTRVAAPVSNLAMLAAGALTALLAIVPAGELLFSATHGFAGLLPLSGVPYKELPAHLSGAYQFVLIAFVIVSMGIYGVLWRVSFIDTLSAIISVGLGLGLGFDILYLQSSPDALIAIANPIEHLQAFSAGAGATLLYQSSASIVGTVATAIGKSLAIHTFISPTHRPTLLIEWLAWAAAVHAYARGRTLVALQIALLLACAIGQDAIYSLRQVKVYYLPYSDPPIILAGALALSHYRERLMLPSWQKAAAIFMALYVVWGHAQPALAVYGRHNRGKVCGIVTLFAKKITIPYCKATPGGGMSNVLDDL